MILYIDHFDSFCNIIIDYFKQINQVVISKKTDYFKYNNSIDLTKYSHVIIGPGPGHPKELLYLYPLIKKIINFNIPTLGICLGHQLLAQYFDAKITYSPNIVHGELSEIFCDNSNILYQNIPSIHNVVRYHSLIIKNEMIPENLKIIAYTEYNEIMAFHHSKFPIYGIQYHPEAYLSEFGLKVMKNFIFNK